MYVIIAIDNATDYTIRLYENTLEEARRTFKDVMKGKVHSAIICELIEGADQ